MYLTDALLPGSPKFWPAQSCAVLFNKMVHWKATFLGKAVEDVIHKYKDALSCHSNLTRSRLIHLIRAISEWSLSREWTIDIPIICRRRIQHTMSGTRRIAKTVKFWNFADLALEDLELWKQHNLIIAFSIEQKWSADYNILKALRTEFLL